MIQVHATCVAREGEGVLLVGPPGVGKSDLALRLIQRGFDLVADDRVEIAEGIARAPPALAGLLEVRGLGIVRLPYQPSARLALLVRLDEGTARLPFPARDPEFGLAEVVIDPRAASAADRVALALSCRLGGVAQVAGAFAP